MNRLAKTRSPYLLQHADNPVDWHPWDADALALARREERPILLSIGYSACHWCHVMAHESFEDPATAEVMNRLFVNIKVDREERPDLDRIYQSAHQLLSRRPGGWPLTVFLTPDDLTPFFAGTYFPREPRHGLPAFRDLLQRIAAAYTDEPDAIRDQNRALRDALGALNPPPGRGAEKDSAPLELARQQLARAYDRSHGGFGGAPKFPQSGSLIRLLRHWAASGRNDHEALAIATRTLERMALGGLHDQVGGGFYRYSVDERWMIPHFEKMLYDNGLLLGLYADAWTATGDRLFADTACAVADWALREMQSPEGGFYAALDADSEGEEGRYYSWSSDEIEALLDADERRLATALFGLGGTPNFEGRWHLHAEIRPQAAARTAGLDPAAAPRLLYSLRQKLLGSRELRVRPGCDDKILTAWNGLMIRGLARAGRLLGRRDYLRAAEQALDFVHRELWRDGRLLASHRAGHSALNAYLDDHAYLLDALLELLQARWRNADLEFAIALAERLLDGFADPSGGGFFFTSNDHETLIHRPKPLGDDATPAGNGIAAFALARLGHLLGEPRYLAAAERVIDCAWDHLMQVPHAHCTLLDALEESLHPGIQLILRGDHEALADWRDAVADGYHPRRALYAIAPDAGPLPGALAARSAGATVTAYLCEGARCDAPIDSLERLRSRLAEFED